MAMRRVIVTLTSIPPRFLYLRQTLDSIFKQSRRPDRIIVNIPRQYVRFGHFSIDHLQRIVTRGVEINLLETDFGPASKLIGLTFKDDMHENDLIICVDDDRFYDPNLVQRHIEANCERQDTVKTQAGWEIEQLSEFSYQKKLVPRGKEYCTPGYVDCLGGACGFSLYRKFIGPDLRNIPLESFFVDDIFLSAYFTKRGAPIFVLGSGKDEGRTSADMITPLASLNGEIAREKLNNDAIRYFRTKWNIWI